MVSNKNTVHRFQTKETGIAYTLVLPVIGITVLFILIPVIGTLWTSFFRDVSYLPKKFIGFENFIHVLGTREFWNASIFTFAFTIAAVAGETLLGMLFALLLHESFRGRGFFRTIVLIPWAIPTIISAKVWKLIFDYTYGVLNYLIRALNISSDKINWLGSALAAFWSLIVAEIWKTTPFMVILLLAGLQAIPEDIYKQATLDGARMVKRFWYITVPLLRPVLMVALIFRTVDTVRIFDLIYVLTGGGPGGKTKTLSLVGFEKYVSDFFGMGSAYSVITFFLVFCITLLYLKAGKFKESFK